MEIAGSSEASATFYQATRNNILENSDLQYLLCINWCFDFNLASIFASNFAQVPIIFANSLRQYCLHCKLRRFVIFLWTAQEKLVKIYFFLKDESPYSWECDSLEPFCYNSPFRYVLFLWEACAHRHPNLTTHDTGKLRLVIFHYTSSKTPAVAVTRFTAPKYLIF